MSMDDDLFNVGENDDMLEEDMENFDMEVDDANEENANDDDDNMDEDEDEDDDNDDNDDDNGDNDEDDGDRDDNDEDKNEENDENDEEDDDDDAPDTANENNDSNITGEPTQQDDESLDKANVNGNNKSGLRGDGAKAGGDNSARVDEDSDGRSLKERVLESIRKAKEFDIVPTVAIPYAQQCHAMAISEGPKWIITGGEDGFIRKYDFSASIEGKAPLTVAQKHNLMDSITKSGVIGSYWENEQPLTKKQMLAANPKFKESDFSTGSVSYEPQVNPVYSLDVERNGFWCLSGLLSGGISLYTMIYNEGNIHHYFRHNANKTGEQTIDTGHLDAVSVLKLNRAQDKFLSGSWDKTIREWDLNTGKVVNLFKGSTGQISSINYRPQGLTDITFKNDGEGQNPSDVDSLFGDSDEEDDANTSKSTVKADLARNKPSTSDSIFMSSSIDGTINIWDARVSGKNAVLRLGVPENAPPWCMTATWSNDGDKLYVGRRNSTVEELSLRMPHTTGSGNTKVPNVLKRLMFPKISGPVTALSTMPNDNFILCGSHDNIRLYNLGLYHEFAQETSTSKKRATPFFVIPGHNGGVLSNLQVDETGRFMISTSGNRGWGHSNYADVVLVYSIDCEGMP
ncbi:CIC11C00000005779 [Sungouiella intermedia]|uniref:CIC11C00000005779 n=1 Tax=Sungouiella intermedia TaxID=45354 RepID=A0A1L0DED0_9ASCO|nr:CIC11C00000005779 [[Candida] intermedia]